MYIIFISLIILIFVNIHYVSYVRNYDRFHMSWYDNLCDTIRHYPSPEFILARKYIKDGFTEYYEEYNLSHCQYINPIGEWNLQYRPVFGDHIHLGYSLHINNNRITLRDHNMSHNVPYENKPSCPNPPNYAYIKKWYHTGVHTHCDDIIHVHPFSAPRELRVEGRKINLGIWFENVGIFYHPNVDKFEIPGFGLTKLNLAYFVHVNDDQPAFQTDNPIKILNTWLVDHQGFVSLSDSNKWYRDYKVLNYKKHPKYYPKRNF